MKRLLRNKPRKSTGARNGLGELESTAASAVPDSVELTADQSDQQQVVEPEQEQQPEPEFTTEDVCIENAVASLEHVKALVLDSRLMVAVRFLEKVEAVLAECPAAPSAQAAQQVLDSDRELFDLLRKRSAACAATLSDWDAPDWILSQTMFGVQTYYKRDPVNGSLWVKMNGVMEDCSIFDQLATVREVDLYGMWMPFIAESTIIAQLGKVELLDYFEIAMPGFVRDCVIHAYACDCIMEDKCILIQGNSVDSWPGVVFPDVKTGWTRDRMIIHGFKSRIEVLSPTSASTSIVANIDPKAPLPQSFINLIMKKAAGMMLYLLLKAAKKISVDPQNAHRLRIASDTSFYRDYMVPKLALFYAKMGWQFEIPIAVLEGDSNRAALAAEYESSDGESGEDADEHNSYSGASPGLNNSPNAHSSHTTSSPASTALITTDHLHRPLHLHPPVHVATHHHNGHSSGIIATTGTAADHHKHHHYNGNSSSSAAAVDSTAGAAGSTKRRGLRKRIKGMLLLQSRSGRRSSLDKHTAAAAAAAANGSYQSNGTGGDSSHDGQQQQQQQQHRRRSSAASHSSLNSQNYYDSVGVPSAEGAGSSACNSPLQQQQQRQRRRSKSGASNGHLNSSSSPAGSGGSLHKWDGKPQQQKHRVNGASHTGPSPHSSLTRKELQFSDAWSLLIVGGVWVASGWSVVDVWLLFGYAWKGSEVRTEPILTGLLRAVVLCIGLFLLAKQIAAHYKRLHGATAHSSNNGKSTGSSTVMLLLGSAAVAAVAHAAVAADTWRGPINPLSGTAANRGTIVLAALFTVLKKRNYV